MRSSTTRAVILAAGMGRRLRPLTDSTPKTLVPVRGTPILLNTLRRLDAAGVDEAVVVVGHRSRDIRHRIGLRVGDVAIHYVEATDWQTANNLHSVWAARDWLDRDLLLIEGDVFLGDGVLERLLSHDREGSVAAVVRYRADQPGSALQTGPAGRVVAWASRAGGGPGWHKTINVWRLDRHTLTEWFLPRVGERVASGCAEDFYEVVLDDLSAAPRPLWGVSCDDLPWAEIDDVGDLLRAEASLPVQRAGYDEIRASHGGWWRHDLVDHAYLVNPYYPPPALLEHLAANVADLVTAYPMGQARQAALVAELEGVAAEHLVVANGASELIAVLGQQVERALVLPVPSFNEFEVRTPADRVVRFALSPPDFDLPVDRFADTALAAGADLAIVVSPNNPTSRAVPREQLSHLATRLSAAGCRLVVDESFVDFAPSGRSTSVQDAVGEISGLAVLRSISKVHGVGGLRLGYLLTADASWGEALRARLPVWNLNGFAEEYLRIAPQYAKELAASCVRIRADTDALYEALCTVDDLHPVRPHANFVLVGLGEGWPDADVVARALFERHRMLIKDCSNKTMPDPSRYLRIASRTAAENQALVSALADLGLR